MDCPFNAELFLQKIFYTSGIFRSIRILRLDKILTLDCDWLRSLNQKKDYLLELHRREGVFERHSLNHYIAKNCALFVDLL